MIHNSESFFVIDCCQDVGFILTRSKTHDYVEIDLYDVSMVPKIDGIMDKSWADRDDITHKGLIIVRSVQSAMVFINTFQVVADKLGGNEWVGLKTL
jgi:hypothetical protein